MCARGYHQVVPDPPFDPRTLTPDHPGYVGNRPTFAFADALPTDWVAAHDLVDDQVEVYIVGDALVLLPSRDREAVSQFFTETLDAETYTHLTGDHEAGAA